MCQVNRLEDVLEVLRAIPEHRVKQLLGRVAEQRPLFGFRKTLGRKLSAVSAIVATMCAGADGPNVTAWRTAYASPDYAARAQQGGGPTRAWSERLTP